MKKLLILLVLFVMGCSSGPKLQDYQDMMSEKVESPFFYVPPLNQKDFQDRTWILLAESRSKIWFYDPYTLSEDEDRIISFDAFILPREKNNLARFNATMIGPYRQKIDCFGNNQWSETLYTQNIDRKTSFLGEDKPVNGSGWVKIIPKTAMAYVHSRLCGRRFLDEKNINYYLYQDGFLPAALPKKAPIEIYDEKLNKQLLPPLEDVAVEPPNENPPIFYEVINNDVSIVDANRDIRQMRVSSFMLDKNLSKRLDYVFTANCRENSYILISQGSGQKSSGDIGAKDSFAAVAFNRACGSHGSYMKMTKKSVR